jgi:hypothetical protein
MFSLALKYRQLLHREVFYAWQIMPHDTPWKTNLYKALCSIPSMLPVDIQQRILNEQFEELNEKLKRCD